MPPNGYRITEPVPGLSAGDVLNVTRRYRHWHRNRMELEQITATPGAARVVVVDEVTGFTESNVLDPTARIGDWHSYDRTFDAAEGRVAATDVDGPTHLTMETLSTIAEPISG